MKNSDILGLFDKEMDVEAFGLKFHLKAPTPVEMRRVLKDKAEDDVGPALIKLCVVMDEPMDDRTAEFLLKDEGGKLNNLFESVLILCGLKQREELEDVPS